MPLTLPTSPAPAQITVRPVSARNDLRPAFGGSTQRLLRKGTKYAVDVVMPPMTYADAMAWADLDDEADTVVLSIPQPGMPVGSPAAPLVDGSNQSGMFLAVKGVAPGYTFRKGQLISVVSGGQRWLYRVKVTAAADTEGKTAIGLQTLLRHPPANNSVVEVVEPKIEGFVEAAPERWTVGVDRLVTVTFTIEERE